MGGSPFSYLPIKVQFGPVNLNVFIKFSVFSTND